MGQNNKRGRNNNRRRQGGGGHGHNPNRSLDSNGPEVKIRGTAIQIYEKYQTLARDAASSGDRVRAESLLQHAEHYFRLMRTAQMHLERPDLRQEDDVADDRLDDRFADRSPYPQAQVEADRPERFVDAASPTPTHQVADDQESDDDDADQAAEPAADGAAGDGAHRARRSRRRRPRRHADGQHAGGPGGEAGDAAPAPDIIPAA